MICPEVSVILPIYNRGHLIKRAILSVLNQSLRDLELIVVDDGSTEDIEKIVNSLDDGRIKYIRHEANRGAGAARNTGIGASCAEYIAFQDSDDEWLPEKLERQIEAFKGAGRDAGIVYVDMLRIGEDGRSYYWTSPTVRKGCIVNQETLDYQVAGLGIQSAMIKRECFNEVGLFDESFPRFIDLEFFIRLSKRYEFYHIKEPLCRYYSTEGISTDINALCIARVLLLKKYFNDIKDDSAFLLSQFAILAEIQRDERAYINALQNEIAEMQRSIVWQTVMWLHFHLICSLLPQGTGRRRNYELYLQKARLLIKGK